MAEEITGLEFLLFYASYVLLVLGGQLLRYLCGRRKHDKIPSTVGVFVAFQVLLFLGGIIVFAVLHPRTAPLDSCVWWALIAPGFWHGSNILIPAVRYSRYKKNRNRKLGHWLQETPPQTKDELMEYIKLTLDSLYLVSLLRAYLRQMSYHALYGRAHL